MDHSKYDGLLSRFPSGDASVVLADLPTLEILMAGEDPRKAALGLTPAPAPSTNHATQGNHDPQAGTRRDEHRNVPPSPSQEYQPHAYQPSVPVQWKTITSIFEEKKSCPHYHSRDDFHWTVGCPVLAVLNHVCVEDETKA